MNGGPQREPGPPARHPGLAALGAGRGRRRAHPGRRASAPQHARAAAAQDWPPFVLVAGLLLVGLVADEDGLFAAGGHALARLSPNGVLLYAGTTVLVVTVTTLLNLDTSVTFLTPVLVYAARAAARARPRSSTPACSSPTPARCSFPGSNLTNLIVLGHLHLSGRAFFAHMALPALAAAVVTALVVGAAHHRAAAHDDRPARPSRSTRCSASVCSRRRRHGARRGAALAGAARGRGRRRGRAAPVAARQDPAGRPGRPRILGLPVLVGLFGLAVALGTLGRSWSGPATLLSHLDAWGTAAAAALTSVLVNNLPAASLLAARQPPHPFALLDRAQRRAEPVRDRLAGLAPVAAGSQDRGRAARRSAGQPARARQRTAGHRRRRGRAGAQRGRLRVTDRPASGVSPAWRCGPCAP